MRKTDSFRYLLLSRSCSKGEMPLSQKTQRKELIYVIGNILQEEVAAVESTGALAADNYKTHSVKTLTTSKRIKSSIIISAGQNCFPLSFIIRPPQMNENKGSRLSADEFLVVLQNYSKITFRKCNTISTDIELFSYIMRFDDMNHFTIFYVILCSNLSFK